MAKGPQGKLPGETQEERTARMRALAQRSAEVRAQRKRDDEERAARRAQTRMDAGEVEPERHEDDLAALQAVIDGAKTLNSDRIRAVEAKQRILTKVYEEEKLDAFGPLLELRNALELLPAEQRVDALGALLRVA